MPGDRRISVIVPALDEERDIGLTLVAAAEADEVVVVDGGSRDATARLAVNAGADVVESERGRARQMNAGAAVATGDILVFVHADTQLPAGFRAELLAIVGSGGAGWGRFDLRFDKGGSILRLIAWLINTRSRLTRGATGDQAIFVDAKLFRALGGYRDIPLFEDVDLCTRLKREHAMAVPSMPVVTSSRRWRSDGAVRVSLQMWALKLMYFAGISPARLVKLYRDVR